MNTLQKFIICVLIGGLLWFVPLSPTLPKEGQEVFAVFIAVIVSFLLRPFQMGPMVLVGLVVLMVTKTIDTSQALTGYGNSTVWLVVAAFLISGAVVETGFGNRIALYLISKLGKNILGIAYGVCGSELILGPIVPSNTARGGGIHAPLVRSLSELLNSYPKRSPRRAGSYLSLVGANANFITAGMFLTGMAANPLLSEAAKEILHVNLDWVTWAKGAIVPGLVGLLFLPLYIYKLDKPELKDTREVQKQVILQYQSIGRWKSSEIKMGLIFVLLIGLWSTSAWHGLGTTLVAWIGVCALFLTNTYDWNKMVRNFGAWDALIWLGGLLTMASILKDYGFVLWFSQSVSGILPDINFILLLLILALIYFFSMYFFSQLTAHIAAFIGVFFTIALSHSIPPMLTAILFAGFSTLCGCLTPYSSGPAIIYFGQGYVTMSQWFKVGFMMALYHIVIWFTFGMVWWKVLGWW